MTMTKTYGQVLVQSFYSMEELMDAYRSICERPVHEDCEITVSMSDWYGDPCRRDIKMSMKFLGSTVLLEEGAGWVARGPMPPMEAEPVEFDKFDVRYSPSSEEEEVMDLMGGPSVSDYDID